MPNSARTQYSPASRRIGQSLPQQDDPRAHHDLGLTLLENRRLAKAITSFRRAVTLKPDFALAWYNLGAAYSQAGDNSNAIAAYRQVILLAPGVASAHGRLADLLVLMGERQAAIDHFLRASAIEPTSRLGQLSRARALQLAENDAKAEEALRQVLALNPADGLVHRELGRLLNMLGRFEEGIAHLEKALVLDPNSAGTYHALVTGKKIDEKDGSLIAKMQSLVNRPELPEQELIVLHFALGKAFNDLKNYADAMHHFDAGNQLQGRHSRFDRREAEMRVNELIANFSSKFLKEHQHLGVNDETPILIVGMPRSGTTLIEQIISSHPAVGAGGELRFWAEAEQSWVQAAPEGLNRSFTQRLANNYIETLRKISPATARVTDKNAFNFIRLGLIHLIFPQARIIHCRRSPMDTCLSIYTTYFEERKDFANNRNDLVFYYRQYQKLMAHWRILLPADRFFELDYEVLVAERQRLTRALVAFCGLGWDDACLRPESNPRVVTTASVWQSRQPVYRSSVERWRDYEPWFGVLRDLHTIDPRS
jgi:tetratricopeptide (TPR) repeat protein